MTNSLRGHLLALLLPVAVAALLVGAVAVYLIASGASAESLDRGLADAARIAADDLRKHPDSLDRELPPLAQRMLMASPDDRLFFSLQDASGRRLAGEGRLADDLPWGTLRAPAFFDITHGGYWLRGISVVFEAGGRALHLTLATTALRREKLMNDIFLGMVAPQMALFLLTILLVWAGVRHALAPLAALRTEIGRRSDRDLRPLAPEAAPQELRPIVEDINRLFARLDRAIASQRHFIADAAHQLRTPVAGLLAQVEAAGPAGDAALAATARRLSRLVGQLLALSRADPGVEPAREDFDLAALVRESANDWLPPAFRRDMDVRFDLSATPVRGSRHAFRELLANLLDNAIRYGRQRGRIVVGCFAEGGEAVLRVDDDGPGIPADQRERVFERFHRLPGSAAEGCGLGLAIVRGLARQHGAKVSLGEAPTLGGLRVDVRLPLRTADREPDA